MPAGEIGIGTSIVTRAGPTTKLQSVEHKSQRVTVYNFEVEGFHSYFVGTQDGGLWVHNKCPSWKSKPNWGHTFEGHGQGPKMATSLTGRAASTGQEQGQWLDNEAAAEFLWPLRHAEGPFSITSLPPDLGRVILPDGSMASATRALAVPNGRGGFKTSFPQR